MRFLIEAPSTAEWVYGFCTGLLVAAVFLLRADYLRSARKDDADDPR